MNLGYAGLKSTYLEGNELELDWTGPHVVGVDWTGLSRIALQWTALHFTGLDCLRLSLTSPDCTTLHYPGLKWKVPYRTVTAPR